MDKRFKLLPNNKKEMNKWLKNITDYYVTTATIDDIRNLKNIQENYDLLVGVYSTEYFNKQLNPLNLKQTENDVPVNDEIIPIILPTLNTLIGESYDRNIDFRAYVVNPDAVSEKEKYIEKEYMKRLENIIKKQKEMTKEELQIATMELQQWKLYEAQDIRERFANHILKDYIERLYFQKKTKNGWKDLIINAQEIYLFDVIDGNVIFENVNPLDISVYGLPNNGNIHEAEAIVYRRYMTISEVMERYGNQLSEKEIIKIVEGESSGNMNQGILMVMDETFTEENDKQLEWNPTTNEFSINTERLNNKVYVRTVYFKVLRKVKKLHYIDSETGEEKTKLMDFSYIPKKDEGEWIETQYVTEYWQSTRILGDIYVDMKRCPVQMRDMNNPNIVWSPIVGKVLKTGRKQAKSIVDYLKPIQYQWAIFSKKVSLLWSRNYGKLVRIDVSKIPKKYGFDVDLFMSWITSFGIIVEDPFNEAMKGQPAGQFSSSVQAVDLELSSSISQALQYMLYLRELADEMVGVNRQRRGDLMASDGLGTTQESISRSLKITEELFQEHHELQKILLRYILEYAKFSLKSGKNKKMQYITDNMIYNLYEVDPDIFMDVDYGIFINNTRKQQELERVFLQLAHAYAQNGAIKLSEVMELYNDNSMADKLVRLKMKEKQQELMQQQMEKQKQEHEQQLLEKQLQLEQLKMQHELELQKLKNEGIIEVAKIQAEAKLEAEEIKAETDLVESKMKTESDIAKSILQYNKQKQQNKSK